MQISPNSFIPVSYSTTIPGDTTLYYVRAVLRDTQSSNILQTLNLTNVSSTPNRYTGNFNPVSDASGLGRPVDITITVYTDSGYTTPSNNYQITQYNYVVLQPWIANLGMGGGLNIDYEKLQNMFDGSKIGNEEIGNEVAKKVEVTKVDYRMIDDSMGNHSETMRQAISSEIKEHITNVINTIVKNSSDVSSFHAERFDSLEKRFGSLEDKIENTNSLSSVERKKVKSEISEMIGEMRSEYKSLSVEHSKKIHERLKESMNDLENYLGDTLSEKEFKMVYQLTPEKKKNMEYSPDISALLR